MPMTCCPTRTSARATTAARSTRRAIPRCRSAAASAAIRTLEARSPAAEKGAYVAYRLKVPFEDAVALKPQRITLADGKTIDLKLPKGLEEGTRIRLTGKGQPGPGGTGDAIVTVSIAP